MIDMEKAAKIVSYIADKQARRLAKGVIVDRDDLSQEGWVATLEAADGYDSEQAGLSAYLKPRVYGAMVDHLRRVDHLTRTHRRELGDDAPQVRPFSTYHRYSDQKGDNDRFGGGGWRLDQQFYEPAAAVGVPQRLTTEEWVEFVRLVFGVVSRFELLLLTLYYRHELTMWEVGILLNVSQASVRFVVARLRKQAAERAGTTVGDGRKQAAYCERSARVKAITAKRASAGLCAKCDKPAADGRRVCEHHYRLASRGGRKTQHQEGRA